MIIITESPKCNAQALQAELKEMENDESAEEARVKRLLYTIFASRASHERSG